MTETRSTPLQVTFAVAALVVMTFFFGMNPVASKILFRPDGAHFDAVGLFTARSAWSLPVFALMALLTRPRTGIPRADWWKFAVLGICFGPGQTGVYALAAQYTSAAHISLLLALVPPLTGFFAFLILREAITPLRIAALSVGIAGAAILTLTKSASGSHWTGDAIMLIFLLSYPFFAILLRLVNTQRRYHSLFITGMYGATGTLALLAAGVALGHGAAIVQPLNGAQDNLIWFFGVIIFGLSILTQSLQTFVLRTIGAGTFSVLISYGSLIFGTGGAIVLLGERLSVTGIVAGLLLAVALGLAVAPQRVSTRESRLASAR